MPGIYFDSRHLPDSTMEYVCWVDVMGIQSAMGRSLDIAANFVFKLHVVILASKTETCTTYPVMDGAYISSPSKEDISRVLRSVFRKAAEEFIREEEPLHRFVVRAGLAFGPVVHGRDVPDVASSELKENSGYRESILLGLPMVQAHLSESHAPPFGIYIHESARSFSEDAQKPFHYVWWKWSDPESDLWTTTRTRLFEHYNWCKANASSLICKIDRTEAHNSAAIEYFGPEDG